MSKKPARTPSTPAPKADGVQTAVDHMKQAQAILNSSGGEFGEVLTYVSGQIGLLINNIEKRIPPQKE